MHVALSMTESHSVSKKNTVSSICESERVTYRIDPLCVGLSGS